MKQTTQLNVEIPASIALRVRTRAVAENVTLNEFALRAFEKFLSMTTGERRVYLSKTRISGRKISVSLQKKTT